MALQNEAERLNAAWQAFASQAQKDGWRMISLKTQGPCRLFAGRHFPNGEEAVFVSFPSEVLPPQKSLPQGNGFLVERLQDRALTAPAIALARREHASLTMFTMMAADILMMMDRFADSTEKDLLYLFLGRIRGWQEFMDRGGPATLGPEAELGLFGELSVLRRLIDAGLGTRQLLDAWQGPQRGLHDFVLGTGALEVKSTLATDGFPARVQSLDQFDPAIRDPILCCAARFVEDEDGRTLPAMIADTREYIGNDALSLGIFETRLIQAGYISEVAVHYTRRFRLQDLRILRVEGPFPRLTASTVPAGVLRARYEVDLDLADLAPLSIADALQLIEGA